MEEQELSYVQNGVACLENHWTAEHIFTIHSHKTTRKGVKTHIHTNQNANVYSGFIHSHPELETTHKVLQLVNE